MPSFLNSLVSGQGGLQVRIYIPCVDGLGLIPGDVAMKWILRHLSHMMPMWTGMGGNYGMNLPGLLTNLLCGADQSLYRFVYDHFYR